MTPKASEVGFAHRLAYVRWLRDRGRVVREADRQFAIAMGVGEKWYIKWKQRDHAPEGRTEFEAFAAGLATMGVSAAWLYDGKGATPEPKLWDAWAKDLLTPSVQGGRRLSAGELAAMEQEVAVRRRPRSSTRAG